AKCAASTLAEIGLSPQLSAGRNRITVRRVAFDASPLTPPAQALWWPHERANPDKGEGRRDHRTWDAGRAELHHQLVGGYQEGGRDRSRRRRAEDPGSDQADRRDGRENLAHPWPYRSCRRRRRIARRARREDRRAAHRRQIPARQCRLLRRAL